MTSFPSPNWLERRTFTYIFFFEPKPLKKEKSPRYYRNPISLAKEYKRMIETGEVKNQSALARKLGVSRVRICQVLSLLKLDSELIKAAEQLGDPMLERNITEKMLREYLKNPKTHNNMLYSTVHFKINCTRKE